MLNHNDLTPRNILIDNNNNVSGIIDWEFSGAYPIYYEYYKYNAYGEDSIIRKIFKTEVDSKIDIIENIILNLFKVRKLTSNRVLGNIHDNLFYLIEEYNNQTLH